MRKFFALISFIFSVASGATAGLLIYKAIYATYKTGYIFVSVISILSMLFTLVLTFNYLNDNDKFY